MEKITQLKTPLLSGYSIEEKRTELKRYFANTWHTYESLFALINDDDAFYLRPEPLRHPLIFYFGHTATFYINKLILGKFINKRINEKLEAICAVGVDEMSWDDLDSSHYDWPTVTEVRNYRDKVFKLVNELIDEMPLALPITQDSLAWIVLMGSEHERIHLETSSVIMRMLPIKFLDNSIAWQVCPYSDKAPNNCLLNVEGSHITLGKKEDDNTYGWDNEYGELPIQVDSFSASQYLVSNQEYLTFVEQGGYQESEYWTEEGKQWLAYKKPVMPRFWFKKNGLYFQRNLTNEIALPLDWPVEVNYLEAKAFCNWKAQQLGLNVRLPTEGEWTLLRDKVAGDLNDWREAPGNINLEYFASSCPVNKFENSGFYDVVGNVWQWTESAIDGFNGFKVHPLYDDFSTPTFDGKHNVIKGGSWISTGNEAIKSSRYAFRRHFFQHAGFRYVASDSVDIPVTQVNHYETSPEICQQLASHYLDKQSNFSKRLAEFVQHQTLEYKIASARLLNLGCGVGRTAFELAPLFDYIDAVDFSAQTIQHAVQLQQQGSVRFTTVNEGEIVDYHEISLANLSLVQDYDNILFSQGDASNLKPIFGNYDVIVLQQVLEQSYQPKKVLAQIQQRLNRHGLLIIASNYQFTKQVTDKNNWLGGIKINGENFTTFDGIKSVLKNNFSLLRQTELPQQIKINARQSLFNNLAVTVWQKDS